MNTYTIDPIQYCIQQTNSSGSNFLRGMWMMPKNKRTTLQVIYAFCRAMDDIVDETENHTVASYKLEWWGNEIERAYNSQASHPIARAIQSCLNVYDLPKEHFHELIHGMKMDLHPQYFNTFAELKNYCYHAASSVGLLVINALGYQDPMTREFAINLGIALQLINIIRDVGEDVRRKRIYIPLEDLKQFGITTDDLLQLNNSDQFVKLMKFQAQRAREYYKLALSQLPNVDRKNQRPSLIMGAIYFDLLKAIEESNFDVLHHKIKLSGWRKIWVTMKNLF